MRASESRRGESRSGPDVVGGLRRHTEGLEVFDRGGHKTQLLFSFRGRVEGKKCVEWVSGESSGWTGVCWLSGECCVRSCDVVKFKRGLRGLREGQPECQDALISRDSTPETLL